MKKYFFKKQNETNIISLDFPTLDEALNHARQIAFLTSNPIEFSITVDFITFQTIEYKPVN